MNVNKGTLTTIYSGSESPSDQRLKFTICFLGLKPLVTQMKLGEVDEQNIGNPSITQKI